MTPLHLAVESDRIKMVEYFLDHQADINLQDDNEVILHTNALDYLELAGKCCIPIIHLLSCLKIKFSVFKLQN